MAAPAIKTFSRSGELVPEGSTHQFTCLLIDVAGSPVQLSALTAVRGKLFDVDGTAPINARADVDLFNLNGGALSDAGAGRARFTWTFTPADAVVLNRAKAFEKHRLTLTFTYTQPADGPGVLTYDADYFIRNLAHI